MPFKYRSDRLQSQRGYRIKNVKRIAGMGKKWRKKHKKELVIKKRKYSSLESTKHRKLENRRDWRKRNPDKWRAYDKRRQLRRRSRKVGSGGSHTTGQWVALKKQFNHCCAMCGMQEPFIDQFYPYLTEDHVIPLSKGGSNGIDNIQPLCHRCNSKKGAS